MEQNAHSLTLENRNFLSLGGVAEVGSFNENEVRLKLSDGTKITVTGSKLQIIGFDKKTGECRLSGRVNSIKYTDAGATSPKRFFR